MLPTTTWCCSGEPAGRSGSTTRGRGPREYGRSSPRPTIPRPGSGRRWRTMRRTGTSSSSAGSASRWAPSPIRGSSSRDVDSAHATVHPSGRVLCRDGVRRRRFRRRAVRRRELLILGRYLELLGGVAGRILTASIGSAPAPRYEASLAYSAKDGELVLFGGETATRVRLRHLDVLRNELDEDQHLVHPSSRAAAMVADGPASGTVSSLAGVSGTSVSLNDTWTFHGLVWTHSLPPPPGPAGGRDDDLRRGRRLRLAVWGTAAREHSVRRDLGYVEVHSRDLDRAPPGRTSSDRAKSAMMTLRPGGRVRRPLRRGQREREQRVQRHVVVPRRGWTKS